MRRFRRAGIVLVATTCLAGPAWGQQEYQLDWSGTFELQLRDFDPEIDDDDVTGFFDQYQFTRNKDEDPTLDASVSEFSLDLLEGEETGTPRLQFRLHSPTSNLNVSGQTFYLREFFLNQRAELYARPDGVALDLDYRRFRTDDLRLFNDAGWFDDSTAPDDRFYVRRTRIGGELRVRPGEVLSGERGALGDVLSEVALRGGYEERKAKRQARISFLETRTRRHDQDVTDGGGGLVLSPGGLFTLALDFDYQRFDENEAADLDGSPPSRTIAFVPDTERTTGTLRLNRRFGNRAVVNGGFQVSSLSQESTRTPRQEFYGLRDNEVVFYSGNLAADVWLAEDWSLDAFFKFDSRRNRIEHEPGLFDRSDGTQVAPFLKRVRRIVSGAEAVYRLAARSRVALGVRGEWIDRKLEFPLVCETTPPGSVSGICPAYAIIDDDSRSYTGYLRGSLRPVSGLQLSAEAGYTDSPETGYIRELDDVSYGELRASYTLPIRRPVTASLFGRWQTGQNDDFGQQAPGGTTADPDFDRDRYSAGGSLTAAPLDGLTLFGSLYYYQDYQDYDLIFSTVNRSRFARGSGDYLLPASPLDYRATNTVLTLGSTVELTDRTDLSLSYTFTRSDWRIQRDTLTAAQLAPASRIRSDINSFEVAMGHWLRKGLRLSAGYRADNYRDRTPVSDPALSSAPAFNLSNWDHTVTLGVTLNSDAFR